MTPFGVFLSEVCSSACLPPRKGSSAPSGQSQSCQNPCEDPSVTESPSVSSFSSEMKPSRNQLKNPSERLDWAESSTLPDGSPMTAP